MPSATTAAEAASVPLAKPVRKSTTNWDALAKIGAIPMTVDCQAYVPALLWDHSCHTHIKPDADTIKRHIESEHGGCFSLFIRRTDGKVSPLWKQLSEAGLEAADFRCGVCRKNLRFHPTDIIAHLKPHAGITKQAYRQAIADKPGCIGKLNVMFGAFAAENVEDFEEDAA